MSPHKLATQVLVTLTLFTSVFQSEVLALKPKPPTGGRPAVVIDERLAALRATPQLSGKLLRRLGRGRLIAIKSSWTSPEGIGFLLVNVSRKIHGWIQREAIASSFHPGDDARVLQLIKESDTYDRISRSRIFLDTFPRSLFRAEVLLLLGDAAEEMSAKLTRAASQRITERDLAPASTYYLNYAGLDRYNRQGVLFIFDGAEKRLHYDGAAWREIIRRFPQTPQAQAAKMRLSKL